MTGCIMSQIKYFIPDNIEKQPKPVNIIRIQNPPGFALGNLLAARFPSLTRRAGAGSKFSGWPGSCRRNGLRRRPSFFRRVCPNRLADRTWIERGNGWTSTPSVGHPRLPACTNRCFRSLQSPASPEYALPTTQFTLSLFSCRHHD